MDVGDALAVYAAVGATIVAIVQRHRQRPSITVWFEVTAERDLVVHATNTGRRPLSVDFIGLSARRWRRGGPKAALPATPGEPARTTLEPGGSTRRTISKAALWQQTREGRRCIYAGTGTGTGRYRRIPTALIRHVTHGPPDRRESTDEVDQGRGA